MGFAFRDRHLLPAEPRVVRLAGLGIEHYVRPLPPHPRRDALLAQPVLDDAQRAELLALAGPLADHWGGRYPARDVVVLEPAQTGLDALLERFARPHTHADDEVRYILDGEGMFGFFDGGAPELVVPVRPGDLLRVPAGVEHRFGLTARRRLKALRLFTDPAGWVAHETGRSVPGDLA